MTNGKNVSEPMDQPVPKQQEIRKEGEKSSEPTAVETNYEKESDKGTAPNIEQPEKTSPAAGREASYVYDVLNMPSTVDTTGLRPDPGFEMKPSTFGQGLQEQSKSADELLMRKDSSDIYKQELAKIELLVKSKGTPLPDAAAVAAKPDYGPEYRLVEDPAKAKLFPMPWQWIAPVSSQVLQKNIQAIAERKDAAVRIADESVLNGVDFTICRDRRLFANRRNTFFLGRYKRQVALVKKISASAGTAVNGDPIWVAIAKRISYTQQVEQDKAANQVKLQQQESSGETTSAASNMVTDVTALTTVGSTKAEETRLNYRPARPFLQVYEIFRLDSDRSWIVFLEMATNKTLHYRVKRRTLNDVAQVRRWSAQILDGITYLANHGVAHRALRLEHLLLDGEQNVRIIGWRRAIALSGTVTRRERRIRSNNHLPPEVFNGGYEPGAVDLWSWGVVLCALATFRYPFNVRHQRGNVEDEWASFKARHPTSGHPQVTGILDALFKTEPAKRATLTQIQQSAWFGGVEHLASKLQQVAPAQAKSCNEKSTSSKSIKSLMGL